MTYTETRDRHTVAVDPDGAVGEHRVVEVIVLFAAKEEDLARGIVPGDGATVATPRTRAAVGTHTIHILPRQIVCDDKT